jgi:hypothetical protein
MAERNTNAIQNTQMFRPLIDKFARFRHETIVKMENMSREEKFKAMKLPELKAYSQNRGITVTDSLPQTRTRSYCLCRRRNFSLLFQVNETQDQLNLSRRLKVHDIQLLDPFKMNVLNDFKHTRLV